MYEIGTIKLTWIDPTNFSVYGMAIYINKDKLFKNV